ncbi:MAG TPA: cysteine--tRNA ligase [bacterium]|nr:cysteine--tRNA ligase [bacterium]
MQVFNTLSKRKEEFVPLHPPFVGIYVCGPTVYDDPHLGHGKSYVSFDVVVRFLRAKGYKVRYVQNITDVGHLLDEDGEDRVIKKARLEKLEPVEIAQKYEVRFFRDMDRLNCLRPDISCRASGHLIEMMELVSELLKRGHAYEVNGNVYFDISTFPDYGKLSRRKVEELRKGSRVEVAEDKRHPADFALWKRADERHIMKWPSPWGAGFPGWHLECSSMAMKYLGESIDIHGGGIDNQFPHHECEIAQSESATGKPFVKYWMHNNMVVMDEKKMSKSLGNFVTLDQLFRQYDPMTVRFFILQGHYRSPQEFSDEALQAAGRGLDRLARFREELLSFRNADEAVARSPFKEHKERFYRAMEDDFNTAAALSVLFDMIRDVQEHVFSSNNASAGAFACAVFEELAESILGLSFEKTAGSQGDDVSCLLDYLVEMRRMFRERKQWELADQIRNRLEKIGVVVEDGQTVSRWRKKQS